MARPSPNQKADPCASQLLCWPLAAGGLIAAPAFAQPDLVPAVEGDYAAHLEALFLDFHRNPELSFLETRTARIMAKELRAVGDIDVTEKVGRTGVVGVMRNGDGPVLLMRAQTDGLPLKEDSGLPYSATTTQVDRDGVVKPVMQACGHDVQITACARTTKTPAKNCSTASSVSQATSGV